MAKSEKKSDQASAEMREPAFVAPGKMVKCKRGLLKEGEPIFAKDLSGGFTTMSDMLSRKSLVLEPKNEPEVKQDGTESASGQ